MNSRQKNVVSMLAAVGVAVALGLYAYLEGKDSARREPKPEAPTALLDVQSPDAGTGSTPRVPPVITWISLDVPQGKTVMERQAAGWRITSPRPGPADRLLVDTLARDLAEAKFKEALEQNPTDEDLVRYGLKPPRATVMARAYVPDAQGGGAEDPSRQHTFTFHVGASNNFDGSLYVQREGDPRVYQAHGALRLALFKNTDGWRDPRVFPVEERSLIRIEVKARKNHYTLERLTTDRPWELVRPVEMPAALKRVEQLVSDIHDRVALGFPDEQLEPQVRKALEKPQVELSFVPTMGEAIRARIAEVEVKGHRLVFALREAPGEPVLAQVDSSLFNAVDLSPLEFKSRQALSVPLGAVARIAVHPPGGGEPIVLETSMDSNRWEVVSPMPGRARQFTVASLLGSLQKLEAETRVDSNPRNWSRYGITNTSAGVSLMDTSGTVIARLWVGAPVPGKPQRVWGRGSSEDVLELNKQTIDSLPLTLEALLERAPAATGTP
ncbi:DUF4340 domain-containing protein [Melittangium boletus]|uniref:DUF4340 domain-containing protein n=1 Tax=Melittangium boletus DSM 14713 TaxID=1294270 RepID=A0A250IKX8_9BACT|nr:DUF4340 domain-containing protein [Melittangium boletus]ATB32414.1 hypothetical protein MEBOL_005892 [Melittangium boletus DSM 14713]